MKNQLKEIRTLLNLINPFYAKSLFFNRKNLSTKEEQNADRIVKLLNNYLQETYANTSYDDNITIFDLSEFHRIFHWEHYIQKTTKKLSSKAASLIPQDGLLIDVGGNVGQFTAQILDRKQIRSIIFEPVPQYRDYCRLLFAGDQNVVIEGVALSDTDENVTLWMDYENMGWNTLISEKTTSNMRPINIKTIRFDDYVTEHDLKKINLIKIDVEGAEYKVLGGMHQTLERIAKKPYIFMEIGWGINHPAWDAETKEFEWLISHGYEHFEYNTETTTDVILRPSHDDQTYAKENWLPHITLGIPTRNRAKSLHRLLKTLLTQTYNNFTVIISEDGNCYNQTQEICSDFKQLSIRVIKGPGHSLPQNRQHILDHASTEFVMMCDDDHSLEPNCIEQLVKTIMSDSSIGIVSAIWPNFGSSERIDWETSKSKTEYRLDLKNINEHSNYWWKNAYKTFYSLHNNPKPLESELSGGGCLIYRKSAVLVAGSFPTCYSSVSFREDTDMSHRIYLSGYRILVQPNAIAWHHIEDKGGCRDVNNIDHLRQKDGDLFLQRLISWRREKKSLLTRDLSINPLRVAILYDEKGWAWWLRTQNISKYISDDIAITSIQHQERFDHTQYDFVVAYEEYLLSSLTGVPKDKIIVGCSCPRYLDKTVRALAEGRARAMLINNYEGWRQTRHLGNAYCCQNGVDDDIFYPTIHHHTNVVACWIGHSQSIGKKGLSIIQAACKLADVKLIILDRAKTDVIHSQEWIRDNIYRSASVYICASLWEGTPNPALEAMMCGLPVISTRVGNMPEIIIDGYNGYLVDRDPIIIAEKLQNLKNSNLQQFSKNAYMTMRNGWLWSQQVVKYEHMFKTLAAKNILNKNNLQKKGIDSILYVRTDSIGDAVIASNITEALRKKYPYAKIYIVCQDVTADLYKYDPNINEVISFNTNKLNNDNNVMFHFINTLKEKKFDLAVNSIWSRTALSDIITLNSGARITIAHEGDDSNISKNTRNKLSQLYTKIIPNSSYQCTEIRRHQDFAQALGLATYKPRTTVHLSLREELFAEAFFKRTGFDPSKTVALFCGVQTAIRKYSYYGLALKHLCIERGLSVVALGAAVDKGVNDANLTQLNTPHYNLSGEASLLETAAVIKKCAIAVGAETGLAHIATAMGIPTAVLLGGGHFSRFMPFSPLHHIACLPLQCYRCNWICKYTQPWCIKKLHPSTLEAAIISALDKNGIKPKILIQPKELWNDEFDTPHWDANSIGLSSNQAELITVQINKYVKLNNAN